MATRTSAANGAWNNAGSWDTGIPVAGDTAVINHNIYIDSNVTVGTGTSGETVYAITINSGGVLRWANPPSGNWTLTLQGGVYIKVGGTFQIGTTSNRIPAANTATVLSSAGGDGYGWRIYVYGGVFDAHGAVAYHMASSSMQRAKLATNIVAGAGVTFDLDRDVDWQVGDWIAFGIGGDKTYTMNPVTWQPERVQITGKNSAHQFVATFTYLHRIGDHAITMERNVILKGTATTDRGIRVVVDRGTDTTGAGARCRMTWAKMEYAGRSSTATYAAIYFNLNATTPSTSWVADALVVQNVVFDKAGSIATGAAPANQANCYGINVDTNQPFTDPACIHDVNSYRMGRVITGTSFYTIALTRIVGIGTGFACVYNGGGTADINTITVDDIWESSHDWRYTSYAGSLSGEFVSITNFELFGVYQWLDAWGGRNYHTSRVALMSISSGKVYHIYGYGAYNELGPIAARFSSIGMYDCQKAALVFSNSSGGNILVRDCTFDACNFTGYSSEATLLIKDYFGEILLYNCSFGVSSPNRYCNAAVNSTSGTFTVELGRLRAEKCTFVEPTDWAVPIGAYKYYNKTWVWGLHRADTGDWRNRMASTPHSVEMRNCIVRSQVGVDQWAIDYPGVTQLAQFGAGGEMRDEATIIIDGTFARKLLPFHCVENIACNYHNPLKIPVAAGKTVTAKLSFRKTKDGLCGLPGLILNGAGIYAEAWTTAGLLNTWEEVVVSGVATDDGMVELLVFPGTNNGYGTSGFTDYAFGPPDLVGGVYDTMFDCVVYADKLKLVVV